MVVCEVAQSCPTLCDPVDCNQLGFSVHGILQAKILEWIAISFSRGSSRPRDRTWVSLIGGRCFKLWATREVHGWFKSMRSTTGSAQDWYISCTWQFLLSILLYPISSSLSHWDFWAVILQFQASHCDLLPLKFTQSNEFPKINFVTVKTHASLCWKAWKDWSQSSPLSLTLLH